MRFRFITPKDPEYPQELMLRWEVLAKPQGIPPGKELAPEEEKSWHLIAIDHKKLVGCVLFCPESATGGRLFQMALSEEYQGRGFGRKLIATLEHALFEKGIQEVHLFSPPEKLGFYTQMGYESHGEPVKERGVLLQRMKKSLSA